MPNNKGWNRTAAFLVRSLPGRSFDVPFTLKSLFSAAVAQQTVRPQEQHSDTILHEQEILNRKRHSLGSRNNCVGAGSCTSYIIQHYFTGLSCLLCRSDPPQVEGFGLKK